MMRLVRELIRPYRWTLAIILFCMLLETAMDLAGPWPLKIIIDNVVGSNHLPHWLVLPLEHLSGGVSKIHIAEMAAIGALLIAAMGAAANYIDNFYTESVGQWVAHDLRMRTYHHLQRLSLRYYDTHRVSALLSTMMTDIDTIQSFASSGTLDILIDLFTILGMLGLMFWINWNFGLLAASVAPVLLILVSRFKKSVKKATKQVRKNESEIMAVVQQGLESERVVKAFGTQDLEETKLRKISQETVNSALTARRVKALLSPLMSVLVAGCVAIVLWRGASLILSGVMTAGVLTILISYLNKFFKPVQDLAKLTNSIAQTTVGVERIQAILDADMMLMERPDARDPESPRGEIVFDHVAFGYDADAPVLRDVSFTIQPGQIVGIVGPTGSGKSTVVSLIPRFYDPTAGRVTIDSVDIRDYKIQGLRKHIGFVLQDTVLFYGSVGENISYGRPAATQKEIFEAARLANADEFIQQMPHGYETLVGDRGLTLSGGQRQRIGIARAIIRNNPILILDEPTSALDAESELEVIGAMERLMKGRTVIMIAHRLSTIRDADKIIVLKGGVVAEEGNHEQLLALGGVYAELHRAQFDVKSASAEV